MTDRTNQPTHPAWLKNVLRDAGYRTGLILDGNVRDLHEHTELEEYVTLPELLLRTLAADPGAPFDLGAVWDPVDGLRFADDFGKSARWFAMAREDGPDRPAGPATAGPETGTAYPLDDDVPTGPAAPSPQEQGSGLLTDPDDALEAMRVVLDSPLAAPLFVLDWSQFAVSRPDHQDPDEREWLTLLGKTLIGPCQVRTDTDALDRRRGLVILLTSNLAAVPPAIYQGEPRVGLVTVPHPDRRERVRFLERHADDLKCERPASDVPGVATSRAASARRLAEDLADSTDGMTLADLRHLVVLSRRTPDRLRPDRLLDLYRFGDAESPWEALSRDKLENVEQTLSARVLGQDAAVRHVATTILRAHLGLAGLHHSARRSKPKGTLFFVGPTGVGKTELAKACAEFLFGDESACIRFDMSEYRQDHADQRLVGAPPGYTGFEAGGQLTNAVRERPFCVLLFDEIEKAHPRVLDKFLQILEDGRLTDGRGETTWFSETIIIFTSNVGAGSCPTPPTNAEDVRQHFERAVRDHFTTELQRPEILNRLGENVVVFNPIEDDAIRKGILDRKLAPLRAHLQDRHGVCLQLTPDAEAHLLQSTRTEHGGRGLLNALERDLLNPLTWYLFERPHQLTPGRTLHAELRRTDGDPPDPPGPALKFKLGEAAR